MRKKRTSGCQTGASSGLTLDAEQRLDDAEQAAPAPWVRGSTASPPGRRRRSAPAAAFPRRRRHPRARVVSMPSSSRANSRSSATSLSAKGLALAARSRRKAEHLGRRCRPSWAPARLRRSWRSRASALLRGAVRACAGSAACCPIRLAEPRTRRRAWRRRGTCAARSSRLSAYCMTGQVGGHLQGEFPAGLAVLFGGCRARPA